jgi:hypothetical protein
MVHQGLNLDYRAFSCRIRSHGDHMKSVVAIRSIGFPDLTRRECP